MVEQRLSSEAEKLDTGLLPDFCDVRVIFMLVLTVQLLAFVLTMAIPSTTEQFWDYLAFISMMLQWIALLNAAVLCISRRMLNRLSPGLTRLISTSANTSVTAIMMA